MDELSRELRRQAARDARRRSLEEALLGNRFGRYAVYRLRYFAARWLVSAAAHASIVWLIYQTFDSGFAWILLAYAAVGFVDSFWWGALEGMRARVRELHRAGKPHLMPDEITRWLTLSLLLALVLAVALVIWAGSQVVAGEGIHPTQAYVAVLVFGVAIQFPVRCYQSGVYAIRRIYRPIGAIFAVEAVSLVGILGLRPWLGAWAFPIAALAAAGVVNGLSVFYTRKAYRLLRFGPEFRLFVAGAKLPDRRTTRAILWSGGSFALVALDSLLIIALFVGERDQPEQGVLVLLFFAAGPTIRASSEWARLLYFDFKRLELQIFRNLRQRFQRSALWLAATMGLLLGVAAIVTGELVLDGSLGHLYWLIVAFFAARSLLALAQVDLFADGAYVPLTVVGIVYLAAILGVGLLLPDDELALGLITAASLLAYASLLVIRKNHRWRPQTHAIELSEWLLRVRGVSGPTRVCGVTLWRERPDRWSGSPSELRRRQNWRSDQLRDEVARRLKGRGAVAVGPSGRIVWFERGGRERAVSDEWLIKRSGGFVRSVRDHGLCSNGSIALAIACRHDELGRAFREAVSAAPREVDPATAQLKFNQLSPGGFTYEPDRPAPKRLDQLASNEKRAILGAAVSFAKTFQMPRGRDGFDVTALCDQGELRKIFVARPGPRSKSWHDFIRRLNIEAAVGTVRFLQTRPVGISGQSRNKEEGQ